MKDAAQFQGPEQISSPVSTDRDNERLCCIGNSFLRRLGFKDVEITTQLSLDVVNIYKY